MTGLLLQIGATKLAVSVVLAGAVWMVHSRVRRPTVSYPLWLLVLVTLLVPAVVSVPVLPAELVAAATTPAVGAPEVILAEGAFESSTGVELGALTQPGLAIMWLLGTAGLLVWTLVQTIRFRRTLARALRPAPVWLQRQAAEIGRDLGLSRIPELCIVHARVTPMVWWTGGKVRVLIPDFLLTDMSRAELRAILAHELAHVRRRDHLVRWLEWLACSVFWWNPVTWWARHQLQIAEEACCDQLALGAGRSCPKTYANGLLRVVASTSEPPGLRPLLPASAVGGAGRTKALERRIRMIVSTETRPPTPRWLRTTGRLALLCALPLGLIYCDWATAVDEETAMDPVEESAPAGMDELSAAADAAARALSLAEAEYQDLIRAGMESGAVSERRGRELSAYLSGLASGRLERFALDNAVPDEIHRKNAESLIAEMVERSRGLWTSPELEAMRTELLELMREYVAGPDAKEWSGEWSGRAHELRTRLREAIGRVPESQEE